MGIYLTFYICEYFLSHSGFILTSFVHVHPLRTHDCQFFEEILSKLFKDVETT